MPSLLDVFVAQRNPQLAGILGVNTSYGDGPNLPPVSRPAPGPGPQMNLTPATAPQAAPLPEIRRERGGFGKAFGNIFAGADDPRLSAEQNEAVRRQTLLLSGLATLASPETGLQAVAQGALSGQAFGAQARERAYQLGLEADREDLRARILSENMLSTREGRVGAVQALLAAGFREDAAQLVDLIGTYESPTLKEVGDTVYAFDPAEMSITDTGLKIPEPPKDTEFQQVGDDLALIDKQNGQWIAKWHNPDRLSASELASLSARAFDQTMQLRKEFQDITGDAQEAIALANAALQAPDGEAVTGQSLVIALNKILDPNSVVREAEFARVAEIGGILTKLEALGTRVVDGRLPPTVEAQVRSEIARLKQAMQSHLANRSQDYMGIAGSYNLNPNQVVTPTVQGLAVDRAVPASRPEKVSGSAGDRLRAAAGVGG